MAKIPSLAHTLVREWAGPTAQVIKVEQLNYAPARVYRLTVNNAPKSSVIAKIWEGVDDPSAATDLGAQFCCEQRAYRFLSNLDVPICVIPEVLAMNDTSFLLTDAGLSARERQVDTGPYREQLAQAFAELHVRTHKHIGQLEPPLPQHVGLRYDREFTRNEVKLGAEFVLSRTELQCVRNQKEALQAAIAKAQAAVETPGQYEAFIHGDIGAARQLSFRDQRLCLFDFEHARIDHAFLDLALPVLGKVEQKLSNGKLIWTGRSFDLTLFEAYKAARIEHGAYVGSQDEWDAQIGAALVYHALAFIGELSNLSDAFRLEGRMTEMVAGMLLGLSVHLRKIRQFPELYFFSSEYLAEHDPENRLGRA